jgi:hypothetical protein
MYTDPSGYTFKSWWHDNAKPFIYTAAFAAIIVGSCILTGGAGAVFLGAWMNACMNMYSPNNNGSFSSFMGACAVGAASGAAGAGIGGGVNAAIAGGSFSSGFIGSATVSSTGFVAGSATGASAGLTSGFISGFGNAGVNSQNFKSMLNQGLNEGAMGLLAGGLIGGISGGINAINNGRTFWSGNAKLSKYEDLLYACNDNDIFKYPQTRGHSVVNLSGHNVYYKPEDGLYGIRNVIPDGYCTDLPIDGLATSKTTDYVFKIPGKYGFRPEAFVGNDGDVGLSFGPMDAIGLGTKEIWGGIISQGYSYGWLNQTQLDNSWETLFNLSKLIK